MAAQRDSADLDSISNIADRINHAVPTDKELETSMTWLTKNDLVFKSGNKYGLTEKGLLYYQIASRHTLTLLKIWDNLETILKKYGG
ncbi:MAG TPA: hypothetical protein VGD40_13085 [Chryseosolibacter sp.]